MSDWRSRYADKLISAEEAAGLVSDGMTVHFGLSSACPLLLTPLIAERRPELRDVIAYGDLMMSADHWDEALADERHIDMRTYFVTAVTRPVYEASRISYHPATCYTTIRRFERDSGRPDIGYFRLSAPDAEGHCSFGRSVWDSKIALRASKLVVAEIAEQDMPRTAGDGNRIHIDEVDHLVELPPDAPARPAITPRQRSTEQLAVLDVVGANAAELVRDGDTVEVGVGAASNAVIPHLAGKHDLGFHSELTGPGIAQLHDAGVFTGRRKSRDVGKMVATALPGAAEERELIAERHFDEWELYGVDYIHNPTVIASQSQMTSINTAIMIDLTGQVVFDSIGRKMQAGPGGQLEFVIGAVYADGGRSIHALPSMAREQSRIIAELPPGANVGIPALPHRHRRHGARRRIDVRQVGARTSGGADRDRAPRPAPRAARAGEARGAVVGPHPGPSPH